MATPNNNKKQAIVSQKDFNFVVRLLKNNWWVPVIIFPIFYAFATLYTYRLTNIYNASTEFLLKNDDAYYKSNLVTDASFIGNAAFMDNSNETRIIKSYDLTGKVVDKLMDRLQVSYYIVGKVRTVEYFNGMPFKIIVRNINSKFYERPLDFRILDMENYEIAFKEGAQDVVKKGKFNQPLYDTELSIEIQRQGNFTTGTVNSLKNILYQVVIHSREQIIDNIRSNLSVENPEFTQILKINLSDVLPERAILILDTLNSVYAVNKLKLKYELNERTVAYIDKQLNEITSSLHNVEDTMQDYKEKRSIINLEWQQSDFLTKISSYDNQRSQMQMQLRALDDLEKYIIEDKDPQFLPPSVFLVEKGGYMSTSATQLYNYQIELDRLGSSVKESNPVMTQLRESINKTKQGLLVYISNTRAATEKAIKNVNKEITEYIAEAKLIPGKQRDILNIQRQASVNEQLYNFLLERRASTKIARASIVPDIKIVESPRNLGVMWPNRDAVARQFYIFALILTALIVAIRTIYFNTISTVEHLRDLIALPLVGVLPQVKNVQNEDIIVDLSPNSMASEAFRNLRTNLQYASVDSAAQTYLVTSFLPGEGKTFTSVNLATMLAKTGKKTVIIELDLHKPRVYKRFHSTMPEKGVTTYIMGQSELEEIVSGTQIGNLFAMFSGPIPPNPSDFVLSEKLQELLAFAKAKFDYVIIDTPPAGLLSDSIYLIQNVDAALFVLNARSSTRKVITFLDDVVSANKLSNVLLVLNGVARIGRKYYYKGYGYSYGYGYGYGYGKGYGYGRGGYGGKG